MRIAVDAQLTVGTATGIGEYVTGLVAGLRDRGVDVVELSDPGSDPWRFDRRVIWDQMTLPRRARASGAALLHCASGTMPLASPGMPVVVTVHDVAWLQTQSHARSYARRYFGGFSLARYREAAAVFVDSEFSRAQLLNAATDLNEERVSVVYPGVAADFCSLLRGAGDGRTILVPGTVERRKNLELVVRALPSLPDARAISVGPSTPYRQECEALAASLGVSGRIEFRGYVSREALLDLYARCAVVAVPSRYEGFGYALAQALCAGAPCVASDAGSLPEVARSDAPVLPVDDVVAWSRALSRALGGECDERAASVRAGAIARLGWSTSVDRILNSYRAVTASLVDG